MTAEETIKMAARRRLIFAGAVTASNIAGSAPQKSANLWKLSSLDDATNQHFKQLVADFAGVPYEREVRNAREAAAELATMMN